MMAIFEEIEVDENISKERRMNWSRARNNPGRSVGAQTDGSPSDGGDVTVLTVVQVLRPMAAAHPVVPLGLLHIH